MPDLGNIHSTMNSIAFTTGYTSVGAVNRVASDAQVRAASATSAEATRTGTTDRVELSEHARFMEKLRSMPPVRAEKVADIKAQIEAGTYETDEKLALALDRLIEDMEAS
jgi:negative regulator of flagellin synthesis FlgM